MTVTWHAGQTGCEGRGREGCVFEAHVGRSQGGALTMAAASQRMWTVPSNFV
jgi:hypothetical protein